MWRWFRIPSVQQLGTFCAVCLILTAGLAAPPAAIFEDETPGFVLKAPDVPLAALATSSSVRFEKQLGAPRLAFHKPDRSARYLSSADRSTALRPQPALHRTYRDLPRRALPTRNAVPRGPDGDPSH